MRLLQALAVILLGGASFILAGCHKLEVHAEEGHHRNIVVTSPQAKDVTVTQQYVCQIHSRRHIEVCALERGYLEEIRINEGQAVKKGDLLFTIVPTLYQAKLDAELAEAQLAELELNNTNRLYKDHVVSQNEVALYKAKLAKAKAEAQLAAAEVNFTILQAPFDGIVDRLERQHGSLIEEGDVLTTLSDNSVMWVYFNVPEARYLEHMASQTSHSDGDADEDDGEDDEDPNRAGEDQRVELMLADGKRFPHSGRIATIEAQFNNETGNIPFRADFPNPDRLLRHGQTGNVLMHETLDDAIVIPQRATFEILDKLYVFVVGKDHAVHQREVVVGHETDDIFVISKGLDVNDKIVLEGVRQVRDGEKVEYEFLEPEEALSDMKHHAE